MCRFIGYCWFFSGNCRLTSPPTLFRVEGAYFYFAHFSHALAFNPHLGEGLIVWCFTHHCEDFACASYKYLPIFPLIFPPKACGLRYTLPFQLLYTLGVND